MPPVKNLVGVKFGRLSVTQFHKMYDHSAWWLCSCECGNTKVVLGDSLRNGMTKSCGCLQKEKAAHAQRSHGMAGTPTYTTWARMLTRCSNPREKRYSRYGGRGISVCERWLKFENFLEDMGEKPTGMSLERKDNDGNYTKKNCKWATRKEQANNKSSTVRIEWNGECLSISEWASKYGVPYKKFYNRIVNLKWNFERACAP